MFITTDDIYPQKKEELKWPCNPLEATFVIETHTLFSVQPPLLLCIIIL